MFKRKLCKYATRDVRCSQFIYTPHSFGLEALDYWLENHPESLQARFNKEFVLEKFKICAKFILQNNNLKFDNKFYNQIKGTAMGTIFAPTYSISSMGYFEIKLYSICTFKYGELLLFFWMIAAQF